MGNGTYEKDDILTLPWLQQMRLRPGMYIGEIGDGSGYHDCIYILLKEVVDNAVDEFIAGHGKQIDISVDYSTGAMSVRDYGRGIPIGTLVDCVGTMNTSGKYRKGAFKYSAGMNGVGAKAVNALSSSFAAKTFRDGKCEEASFERGELVSTQCRESNPGERRGTLIQWQPDATLLPKFTVKEEHVIQRIRMYAYVNPGLKFILNGQEIVEQGGLSDLVQDELGSSALYRPFHIRTDLLEIIFTHTNKYGEEFFGFVNGQYTTDGGTHLTAFQEALTTALNEYAPKKKFDGDDVREGIFACISIWMDEPNFVGQTKVKLAEPGQRIPWVNEWKKEIFTQLHRFPEETAKLLAKVEDSSRIHGQFEEIKKKTRKLAAASVLNIRKLEDCREHLRLDRKGDKRGWGEETMIFITEGDSAGGTVSRARDARYQAVYPLRGKVKNMTDAEQSAIVDNAELYNMVRALGVQDSLDRLRYGKIVFATDADVDGLHIRNLLIAFFMRFLRPLVAEGRVFILETPLFRVRKTKEGGTMRVRYCYSEKEREAAVSELGNGAEQTRFKGLGEITPEDFTEFIGKDIRLLPVTCTQDIDPNKSLAFYMGDNTPARRDYIMRNLVCTEKDIE
ncbi:MAG: type IIA DNA topoisomerase subunit B [Victivallales bacterium]|nr:type IIA DNA topoisomerase subunit B [Victivallales bacterium]